MTGRIRTQYQEWLVLHEVTDEFVSQRRRRALVALDHRLFDIEGAELLSIQFGLRKAEAGDTFRLGQERRSPRETPSSGTSALSSSLPRSARAARAMFAPPGMERQAVGDLIQPPESIPPNSRSTICWR